MAEGDSQLERLLTAREVGEYLGLLTSTVLDRFECGDLPGFRLFGRKGGPVRFRLEEIEAALQGWHVNEPGVGAEAAAQLLDAKHLAAELGITRSAPEAIMRRLPIVAIDGLRKVYVKRSDVAAYIDARTFEKDQMPT